MADQEKEKSPEELGEAVGRKIEALFGGFFGEDATQLLEVQDAFKKTADPPQPVTPPAKRPSRTDTIEMPSPVPLPVEPVAADKPVPAHGPVPTAEAPSAEQPFEDIAELIEAWILKLEWEVSPEVIAEVADRFKEMDSYFPGDARARNVLAMNYRILQRFKSPDGSSHPSLVKMLQDSLTVLKLIRTSPGNRQSIESMIAGITSMYKLITAATAPPVIQPAAKPAAAPAKPTQAAPRPAQPAPKPGQPPLKPVPPAPKPAAASPRPVAAARPAQPALKPPQPPAKPKIDTRPSGAEQAPAKDPQKPLLDRIETAVKSLEDMGRRLTRIVGILRDNGELSGEELTTRTVERLLNETTGGAGIALGLDSRDAYRGLLKKAGNSIHSLEEVSQRFSRILGVFRQGGDMSGEEIIRRLGTLEHLFTERLGELSSCHKQLANIPVSAAEGGATPQGKDASDGLLTLLWAGTPLAIPSSLVTALFPLTKVQAEQLKDKPSIVLGGRTVQRLPLKKSPKAGQANEPVPTWLVHVTLGEKDFFLMAERSLGYRRSPDGLDVNRESRINLGETSFAVLNQASFR